jgi:hypothetical protein
VKSYYWKKKEGKKTFIIRVNLSWFPLRFALPSVLKLCKNTKNTKNIEGKKEKTFLLLRSIELTFTTPENVCPADGLLFPHTNLAHKLKCIILEKICGKFIRFLQTHE